jgi:hypothetical protein
LASITRELQKQFSFQWLINSIRMRPLF